MMNLYEIDPVFFKFEEDFVHASIRCIPMIVRFKLDACGIKLKLAEWSRLTVEEREDLATANIESPGYVEHYREKLGRLIFQRTGVEPTNIPVPQSPTWSRTDEIPYTIKEKMQESSFDISLIQWQELTILQRFALLKLSYPGHENKNFPLAMEEFGFVRCDDAQGAGQKPFRD